MRPVKYFLTALAFTMLLSVFANADFNQRLNYQGRLVDSNGVPLADGNYQVTFEICTDAPCTTVVWTEIHASEAFVDGMFSAILGGTTALSAVDFESATYYLRVSIGGTAYSPTQQLTATAMALNVRNNAITSAKVLDNTLTAADLNVNVVSSVDGVTNDGGDIDLVAGAGISITPNDGANTITIAAVSSGIDHGSLLGLGDDDHTQYFHLSQNETVAGIPAFNGGTTGSSAPFSVDSTFLVTNLNADLLDGQTGSYYQNASNINAGTLGTGYYSAYSDLSAEGYLGNAAGDIALNNGTVQATLNADQLDSLDSASFLRSDASDDFTGTLLQLRANGDLAVSDGYICVDDNGVAAGACLGSTDGVVYADDFVCNGGACIDAADLNDGALSGLDADLLDGQHGAYYQNANNINAGTLNVARYSAYSDLGNEGYLANAAGDLALNNGTVQATLNADMLDGLHESSLFNLSENEVVTGVPAFNGGTSGVSAPFSVDSTFVVTNLNADLLDGQTGSYYQNANNINAGTLNVARYSAYADLGNEGYLANAAGDLALNNGTLQATLNADLLDGQEGSYYMPASTDNWVNTTGDIMTGALAMSGANGDITFDNAGGTISNSIANVYIADSLTLAGDALPEADNTRDLGSATYSWNELFLDGTINCTDCLDATDITDIYVFNTGDDISGGLTMSQDAMDVLNFTANSTSDSRGISFNARTAVSSDFNDGWLRLNQNSEFTSGTYTPGMFRADGGYQVDGATVVDAAGQYFQTVTPSVNKFGAVNASGWGVDALNSTDWDLLIYENQSYTSNLKLGYNGTAILDAYDTNETLYIRANGTGNINVMDSGTGNFNVYRPIDLIRGDTSFIHSLGRISFDWTAGTYDDSSYHGIESESEVGALGDSIRVNSYGDIINTIDSNANGTNYFKVQKESTTDGTDLLVVNESGNLWIAGDFSAASYATLDARYLNASGGDAGSGGTYSFTNNAAGANVANFTGGADDTSYEWVGFYSGGTRYGIFIWDLNWSQCAVNNTFCMASDGGKNLQLASGGGTIYMSNTLEMRNQAITNINWAASDDGSGSSLDADLLDGNDSSYYKCEFKSYTTAASSGTPCPSGKMVVGGQQDGVVIGGASYNRVLVNPSSGSGAPTTGYMLCCPAVTPFP